MTDEGQAATIAEAREMVANWIAALDPGNAGPGDYEDGYLHGRHDALVATQLLLEIVERAVNHNLAAAAAATREAWAADTTTPYDKMLSSAVILSFLAEIMSRQ